MITQYSTEIEEIVRTLKLAHTVGATDPETIKSEIATKFGGNIFPEVFREVKRKLEQINA